MKSLDMTGRPGVSLVEVLVALTLTGVVLTGLGGLAFSAARQTVSVNGSSYRQGVLTREVNRLTALPFADLAGTAGCTTVTDATFPHQRCIAVTSINSRYATVRIVVTPTQASVRADTVVLHRTRPPVGSPLSTS